MAATPASKFGPYVPRFLDLLAFAEGTSTHPLTRCNGYDVGVTGLPPVGMWIFTDFSDHPFDPALHRTHIRFGHAPNDVSDAAGRYQLLGHYWPAYRDLLHLTSYHPDSQDLIAVQQIKEKGGLGPVLRGDWRGAVQAVCKIWASLPGADYGQGGKTWEELEAEWQRLSA